MSWKSIDAAPRDGTRILGVDQVGWVTIIRWNGKAWVEDCHDLPDWDIVFWAPLPVPEYYNEQQKRGFRGLGCPA